MDKTSIRSRGDSCNKVSLQHRPIRRHYAEGIESEYTCWDPKDGELCLNRVKPEETLVEARSGTDVQIVRQIWV